jgi:Lysyl oxidase/Concanavalin A-like lectin/glucanases superfamily/Immunoglobulin I-set domain/Immunoglobulin domain
VNGNLEAQGTVTFAQNYGTLPLYFGTSGESYWDHKLQGDLDEVSLYSRPLLSNEIAAIYSAGAAGKCKAGSPPDITASPQSQSLAIGASALFSVTATGAAPLGYQWQFNSAAVAGATSASLTVTNVQLNSAGDYAVVVTNAVGSVTSAVAVLIVLTPPTITSQPQSSTNLAAGTATFTATAAGSAPLGYQWQFNGANLANSARISGAISNTLAISGLLQTDSGNYTLVVNNAAGAVTSAVATLTVNGPPSITAQPGSQAVTAGDNPVFAVTASGSSPVGYQWQFNGANLSNGGQFSGAATPALMITDAQPTNAGGYSVVVSNPFGSVTSAVATLTVNVPGSCLLAPPGLVGWWPGEGNANDAAGPDGGTLEGGATATAPGFVGRAFTFDGTNGYVQIPDSPILDQSNLTVEAWVNFSSLDSAGSGGSPPGNQYIVFKQNTRSTGFEGIDLRKTRLSTGDVFRFLVTSATGQSVGLYSQTTVSTGVWYHIAAVRGSNYIQLYVNGNLEAQATVTFPQDYGTLPLYFGTSGESYWDHKLQGSLDEVSLYNRPLAAGEIAAIYAAGSGGKCKGEVQPTIVTQPVNTTLVVGTPVSFSVGAVGTAPLGYQWFKDGLKLFDAGEISGSTNSTLTLANPQLTDAGDYQVKVANNYGAVTSVVALLTTGSPPPNDNFANAQAISGSSGSVPGENFNATKESGEPNHAGNAGGASVWYAWTAPSTSPVTFDTCLSDFDTLLAVYTGNAVNALTAIASNDDVSTNNPRSRLTFTPVTGTVYYIAVDGKNDVQGNLTLRWVQASVPLPDLSLVASAVNPMIVTQTFATNSCAVLEGYIQAGTRTIIRFDTETENSGTADLYFGNPATNGLFVWAPCHAHYHFQNYMSYRLRDTNDNIAAIGLKVGFCILDVFRWSPSSAANATYTCVNQGIQVGWGDLYDSTLDGQWIDITGLPPGNYTMELEANPQGIILESNYTNNIIHVPIAIGNPNAPPLNDDFANAQTLLGGFSSVPGDNANATKEPGEPNHAGNAGGHSVWYQWTAVSTKPVTIDTIGSSFNTLLAVYTGSSVSALTLVASNDDIGPGDLQSRVTFSATAGTVYNIAVDGFNGAIGNIVLTLNQTIGNDNFAQCQFVGGVSGLVYGSNAGATKEPGEPDHAGNPGGASIWYCWTAPIDGEATFNTLGSDFQTLLAVYTGSSVSNLTYVASDAAPTNGDSSLTFEATGLTMYHIAIDGFNGATGDTTLNWNLAANGSAPLVVASLAQPQVTAPPQPGGLTLSSSFLADGECRLTINGLPQQRYRIEISGDLVHWRPSAPTVADSSGRAYFTDKTTMNLGRTTSGAEQFCGPGQFLGVNTGPRTARFYRVVLMGPD